jgi:hypothetical protein
MVMSKERKTTECQLKLLQLQGKGKEVDHVKMETGG